MVQLPGVILMFPDHDILACIHHLIIRAAQFVLANLDGRVAMLLYLYDVEFGVLIPMSIAPCQNS